jgi:hypothetical protein
MLSVNAGDKLQISANTPFKNFSGTTLTGGSYYIGGTLQFNGADIVTNAANIKLTSPTGEIVNQSGTNALLGFATNAAAGVFTLSGNANFTTSGSFTNAGLLRIFTGSTFTVGGGSFNFTQTGGSTLVNGTLASGGAGSLNLNGGTLFGTGTIDYGVVDAATITPGESATSTGALAVKGTYTQNAGGNLDVTIGGLTAGTQFDQLNVKGTANLNGTLNISLASGYTPQIGNTFDILTASSPVSGTFSTVDGLAINSIEHFSVATVGDDIVLTVVSGAEPAARATLARLLHLGGVRGLRGWEASRGLNASRWGAPRIATPASAPRMPAIAPMQVGHPLTGAQGFHAMDDLVSAPATSASLNSGIAGAANVAGASNQVGMSSVSGASYNSMGRTNHMSFEYGVDLKELFKTSGRQLLKGLLAAPDSANALSIGYMTYNGSH